MGGNISVESVPAVGSVFIVKLPAVIGIMAKILLVEDNEFNRDMLSRRLIKNGFEITVAVDGVESVQLAKSVKPDLILMDMSLPVMDGWEATSRSRPILRLGIFP